MLISPQLWAQYKSEREAAIPLEYFYIERQKNGILRTLLNKVHISLSTGYGRNFLRHELGGFGIVQQPAREPVIFTSGNTATRYTNWFNSVAADSSTIMPGSFMVNADTAKLGFKGRGFSIPLKATLHIEFDRYRIGGGYSYEFTHFGDFRPTSFEGNVASFSPQANNFFMKKYFGMIGAMVYRYDEYTLTVDANIGGYKLGRQFNQGLIRKGIYFNLGLTAEREMSEYFRLFIRPSYEFKNYKLGMPESGPTIKHTFNQLYVNIGFTYRLPELRRCFLRNCHAQINHAHGNREYRSRRHPIWKKQNPHYGENYPTLIKYKGKNKKKLNPY